MEFIHNVLNVTLNTVFSWYTLGGLLILTATKMYYQVEQGFVALPSILDYRWGSTKEYAWREGPHISWPWLKPIPYSLKMHQLKINFEGNERIDIHGANIQVEGTVSWRLHSRPKRSALKAYDTICDNQESVIAKTNEALRSITRTFFEEALVEADVDELLTTSKSRKFREGVKTTVQTGIHVYNLDGFTDKKPFEVVEIVEPTRVNISVSEEIKKALDAAASAVAKAHGKVDAERIIKDGVLELAISFGTKPEDPNVPTKESMRYAEAHFDKLERKIHTHEVEVPDSDKIKPQLILGVEDLGIGDK